MRTCQPWCVDHLDDDDMCIATNVTLDFGHRGDDLFHANQIVVDLTEAPDSTCLMLHLNGVPMMELDPEQATAIGWAFLTQAANARGETAAADLYRELAQTHAAAAKEDAS